MKILIPDLYLKSLNVITNNTDHKYLKLTICLFYMTFMCMHINALGHCIRFSVCGMPTVPPPYISVGGDTAPNGSQSLLNIKKKEKKKKISTLAHVQSSVVKYIWCNGITFVHEEVEKRIVGFEDIHY